MLQFALPLLLAFLWLRGPVDVAVAAEVVPIDWGRFKPLTGVSKQVAQGRSLLLHSARYNLAWIDRTFELDRTRHGYVLSKFGEDGVRPACSVIYGMGVALKTGDFDAGIAGCAEAEAKERSIRLLRGVVSAHRANCRQDPGWGAGHSASDPEETWQTALWAALSGMGAWLMWDDLDPSTRQMTTSMLEQESKRFFASEYRVPYWNGIGGDTKAEENSWNSMILALLTAMMPEHPQAEQWKSRASELMISAYATEEDWKSNETWIDGRPVNQWLAGYNADPGGVVVNHGFVHPDYMGAISMNFWGLLCQSLAGRPSPQAWDFNGALVYGTLASKQWPSPPYEPPGGAIYVPGKANVYYPRGSDWSYHDVSLYYLMDVYASPVCVARSSK